MQQQQPNGMQESLDVAKGKMSEFMKTFKQSASETYSKVQEAVKESENTKKVGSELSSFFSGAFNKLKGAFGSKTTSTNIDDLTKQEAIKAFDDYAQKHPK